VAQRSEDELSQLVLLLQPRDHLPDAAKNDHSEDDKEVEQPMRPRGHTLPLARAVMGVHLPDE
jgi:hypothetical protein